MKTHSQTNTATASKASATSIRRKSRSSSGASLFGAIQAKLSVGPANDHYERQADAMADQVVSAPAPNSSRPSVSPQAPSISRMQAKPIQAMPQDETKEEAPFGQAGIQRQALKEEPQMQAKLQRQEEKKRKRPKPDFDAKGKWSGASS